MRVIFKNFSYVISTNFLNMLISILMTFLVSKIIGVESYGYWQLFTFYGSYVPILTFGISEGIYLRYGGQDYKKLENNLFFSQYVIVVISQFILAIVMFIIGSNLSDLDMGFIFKSLGIFLLLVNTQIFLGYILQATAEFKSYSVIIISGRLVYLISMVIVLFFKITDYKFFIVLDILSRTISLIVALKICFNLTSIRFNKFKLNIKETKANVFSGLKLTISNTVNMLIIGVIRNGIAKEWSIATFGKVSLTLNLSNFIMVFLNAISLVLYPIIKKVEDSKLATLYIKLRNILMPLLFLILPTYFIISPVLTWWLPKYQESMVYLSLTFPILIYEGKMSMLISTFLKVMRCEAKLLYVNLMSLFISVLLSVFFSLYLSNLTLSVLSITIVLAIRNLLAEIMLSNVLCIKLGKSIIVENLIVLIFIYVTWFFSNKLAMLVVIINVLLYVFYNFKNIKLSFLWLKKFY